MTIGTGRKNQMTSPTRKEAQRFLNDWYSQERSPRLPVKNPRSTCDRSRRGLCHATAVAGPKHNELFTEPSSAR